MWRAALLLAWAGFACAATLAEVPLTAYSFAPDKDGGVVVLEQERQRVVRIGADGKADVLFEIPAYLRLQNSSRLLVDVDRNGNIFLATTTSDDTVPGTQGRFQPQRSRNGSCSTIVNRGPAPRPCTDVVVAKFDSSGTLLWATYLGGWQDEFLVGMKLDPQGNAVVLGSTDSGDFPLAGGFPGNAPTPSIRNSVFAAKLDAEGRSLVFAGTLGTAPLTLRAVAFGADDSMIFAGTTATSAPGFPRAPIDLGECASLAPYLLKLSPAGTLETIGCFSRLGFSPSAVAQDAAGHIYVAGHSSPPFPAPTPGALNPRDERFGSFAVKIAGGRVQYIARVPLDAISSAAVDQRGALYLSGSALTSSTPGVGAGRVPCYPGPPGQFHITPALLRLSPQGSEIEFATFERIDSSTVGFALGPGDSLWWSVAGSAHGTTMRFEPEFPDSPVTHAQCVKHAATFLPHSESNPASGGQIVTIMGSGLGPLDPETAPQGAPSEQMGNTRVLAGGKPALLLYASDHQINAILPDDLAGTVELVVEREGKRSPPLPLTIAPSSPGLLRHFRNYEPLVRNETGAFNGLGLVTSPGELAMPGSVITLFLTGAADPRLPVRAELVRFDGRDASPIEVIGFGPDPGNPGVQTVRLRLPTTMPFASRVRLTVGNMEADSNVYIRQP